MTVMLFYMQPNGVDIVKRHESFFTRIKYLIMNTILKNRKREKANMKVLA